MPDALSRIRDETGQKFVIIIDEWDVLIRDESAYGLRTINVLTGFKFIGEQIGKLEKQGKADSYVFGFEESYGYLTGSYVRDKDGVDGAYIDLRDVQLLCDQGHQPARQVGRVVQGLRILPQHPAQL